jgi:hypothetical protein
MYGSRVGLYISYLLTRKAYDSVRSEALHIILIALAGNIVRMGEERKAYKILVGEPEGIRRFGRPRRRWEGNIKMDLKETCFEGVASIIRLRIETSGRLLWKR